MAGMKSERYDIVIIGSGAGGGTVAHALADSPARILVLERGGFVPQEMENWDPEAVWKHLRYRVRERWVDRHGAEERRIRCSFPLRPRPRERPR